MHQQHVTQGRLMMPSRYYTTSEQKTASVAVVSLFPMSVKTEHTVFLFEFGSGHEHMIQINGEEKWDV
jgi:hypothetical protein